MYRKKNGNYFSYPRIQKKRREIPIITLGLCNQKLSVKKKGGGRVYISYCYLLRTQPVPGTKQMPQGLPTQKCSLRSSSINLTWKMVRNAESRAPPQTYRLRISKFPGESHTLKWDKMSGKIFYYVLKKAL